MPWVAQKRLVAKLAMRKVRRTNQHVIIEHAWVFVGNRPKRWDMADWPALCTIFLKVI